MGKFNIEYKEMQERVWVLAIEADSIEDAEKLFEENNEDPWRMSTHEKCDWANAWGADGEATDTYETEWNVKEID